MNLNEIKNSVNNGTRVFWKQSNYEVIKDKYGYLIMCLCNQSCIGLTHRDGVTMNGDDKDFYIEEVENHKEGEQE